MKALFFDLDGTLLDSTKHIPSSAVQALTAARARGVQVYFATARSPRLKQTLGWTAREFSLFDGGIYSNGGYTELAGAGRYAFIDAQAVRRCVDIASGYADIHMSLHSAGHGYTLNFPLTDGVRAGWGITEENLRPLDEYVITHSEKMMVFRGELIGETEPLPEALYQALAEACEGLAHCYLTDRGASVQISALDAGKLAAIRGIQARMGWADAEIAVFGDDSNDLEMIGGYPVSIAMGNGAQAVRAAAAYVTRANDADGVAYALREILHVIE